MNFFFTLVIYSIFLIGINGCAATNESRAETQNCSSEWYALIEKKISTGDDQGHGPDLGSIEWRSVIEFKLGIRGDAGLPPRKSEQWCNYINAHFI